MLSPPLKLLGGGGLATLPPPPSSYAYVVMAPDGRTDMTENAIKLQGITGITQKLFFLFLNICRGPSLEPQ